MTVLAIPPLLPAIHRDLHLDEKLVGALTALPVLLLAGAAVLGSLLVARLGARHALLLGLCLVAGAGAARGAGHSITVLFLMTFIMGAGIAVSQPALPSLVRQWFPAHSGLATAAFSNGILVGEILAASLTVPFIISLVNGRWESALVVWSLPVVLTALAIVAWTPGSRPEAGAVPALWWPDWRKKQTWRLGIILGCASTAYFASNAFIPDYLKVTHHATLVAASLTSLNLGQLPASLMVAASPRLFIARRWPIVASGMVMLVAALGLYTSGSLVVIWAGILGFASAMILVLLLALPPILTAEHDVHRLSAAMFAITYTCSFSVSRLGGAVWDATSLPATAFVPVAAAGPIMIALAWGLDLGATHHDRGTHQDGAEQVS